MLRAVCASSGHEGHCAASCSSKALFNFPMHHLQLLTLADLATLLRRGTETIRKDIVRNPEAVPPRFQIPGTRLLRWRPEDVERWQSECSTSKGGLQ